MVFEDSEAATAAAAFSPFPMAFKVKADDLLQRIMIRIAATVRTMPPITADKIVMSERLSERIKSRKVCALVVFEHLWKNFKRIKYNYVSARSN